MKRRLSLYQWGVPIRPQRHHIWIYGVFSTSRLFSGDSGTATLLSPRIFQPDYTVPGVHPGCHPGHGTTCSGYKHFTLIDEKTSLPLSVRGAYKATMAPYLNIWCLQYFPLIQRRQRNRHTNTNLSSLLLGMMSVCSENLVLILFKCCWNGCI